MTDEGDDGGYGGGHRLEESQGVLVIGHGHGEERGAGGGLLAGGARLRGVGARAARVAVRPGAEGRLPEPHRERREVLDAVVDPFAAVSTEAKVASNGAQPLVEVHHLDGGWEGRR